MDGAQFRLISAKRRRRGTMEPRLENVDVVDVARVLPAGPDCGHPWCSAAGGWFARTAPQTRRQYDTHGDCRVIRTRSGPLVRHRGRVMMGAVADGSVGHGRRVDVFVISLGFLSPADYEGIHHTPAAKAG